MKKITLITLIFSSIFLFSYRDYGSCNGVTELKALTCGSCHGGSISEDIFIMEGKNDDDSRSTFVYELAIPVKEAQALQLGTRLVGTTNQNPKIEGEFSSSKLVSKGRTIFNLVSLFQKNANIKNGNLNTSLSITFDEPITEQQTIAIQGVLSNEDGTVDGDRSFYQEVVINPVEKTNISEAVSVKEVGAYYTQQKLMLKDVKQDVLRIVDLQGRVVKTETLDKSKSSVDLSSLNQGLYRAVFGSKASDIEQVAFRVE